MKVTDSEKSSSATKNNIPRKGYAAKYHFVHKDYDEDYKKEPWYFGDMTREEAEHWLGDNANPNGQLDE